MCTNNKNWLKKENWVLTNFEIIKKKHYCFFRKILYFSHHWRVHVFLKTIITLSNLERWVHPGDEKASKTFKLFIWKNNLHFVCFPLTILQQKKQFFSQKKSKGGKQTNLKKRKKSSAILKAFGKRWRKIPENLTPPFVGFWYTLKIYFFTVRMDDGALKSKIKNRKNFSLDLG